MMNTPKSPNSRNAVSGSIRWIIAAGMAGVVIAGGAAYYALVVQSDRLPRYDEVDLDENRAAGKVSLKKGEAFWRSVQPAEREAALDAPPPASAAEAKAKGWTPVKDGEPIYLGSLYYVPRGALFRISTAGNWLVTMDGEGEFYFDNARRSSDGTKRSLQWFVKRGTFRAKSHDWDPNEEHWIEVSTRKGRVLARRGPMGMRINDEGGGHVWLWKGEAVMFTADGERRELQHKKPERL